SVQILLDEVRNFLSCETTAEIAPILYNHYKFESKVYYDKSVVSLSWESTGADSYKLYIADNAYFKNAATLEVNTNSCNVGFLIPGKTYYYRVADSENRRSDADFFRVSDEYSVRYISAGNYVSNMRDLGGWKTDSGKTVKYGMIYRSGHFDDMSKTDEQSRYGKFILKDILGIKTEIDLRNTSSRPGTTFIDVNFIECPMTPYSYIIPSFSYYSEQFGDSYRFFDGKTVLPSIKRVFETFADINNYPISYHCAAGADRTGTISFLLNGLLGVSYDDLMLDYELTSFSKQQRRWRSNIVGKLDEDGRMIKGDFDDLGIMEVKGSYFGFGRMFNDIMSLYGTGDGKISSAVANYLKTVCGVEQQTFDKIKTIMLI
ncbi:MAG: tyrosine-protein phosphatase, partial [Clostridia bacterium]|nr:tyrosine-protein phosphatase [Clostridia bacterium]